MVGAGQGRHFVCPRLGPREAAPWDTKTVSPPPLSGCNLPSGDVALRGCPCARPLQSKRRPGTWGRGMDGRGQPWGPCPWGSPFLPACTSADEAGARVVLKELSRQVSPRGPGTPPEPQPACQTAPGTKARKLSNYPSSRQRLPRVVTQGGVCSLAVCLWHFLSRVSEANKNRSVFKGLFWKLSERQAGEGRFSHRTGGGSVCCWAVSPLRSTCSVGRCASIRPSISTWPSVFPGRVQEHSGPPGLFTRGQGGP